jgi:hypothetical protein
MKYLIAVVLGLLITVPAHAGSSDKLEGLVGYTIIASKTIDGYRDSGPNGKRGDDFEGCDFDKVIVFRDGTSLTCAEYGYQYAYAPTAIIFAKQISSGGHTFYDVKMLVDDEVYDMRK